MRWGSAAGALLMVGCGLTLDLDPPDPDGGGLDAAPTDALVPPDALPDECDGQPDGAPCGLGICLDGRCQPSVCGDGFVDANAGEECEGERADCVECRFECDCPDLDAPCLDGVRCVGGGACVLDWLPDGTVCGEAMGVEGVCVERRCVPLGCGDGEVEGTEECDDGNSTADDGCEPDCTFSCRENADCDDGDVCNGFETCVERSTGGTVAARKCEVTAVGPSPGPCERCDPGSGPFVPDADGDGFAGEDAPDSCPERDCDDANPAVFPGAADECDGLDNDCDGLIDEEATTTACGPDRDGDGWAGTDSGAVMPGCGACPAGSAPIRSEGVDCWDVADAFGPMVNPAQTGFFPFPFCAPGDPGCGDGFDWNCDGTIERQLQREVDCDSLRVRGCRGDGWQDGVPACGDTASFVTCEPRVLFCGSSRATATQACR